MESSVVGGGIGTSIDADRTDLPTGFEVQWNENVW